MSKSKPEIRGDPPPDVPAPGHRIKTPASLCPRGMDLARMPTASDVDERPVRLEQRLRLGWGCESAVQTELMVEKGLPRPPGSSTTEVGPSLWLWSAVTALEILFRLAEVALAGVPQ